MRTRHFSSSDSVPSFTTTHRPVLLHEVIRTLAIRADDIVVDATLGGAGHAKALVKGLGGNGLFIGFDVDREQIERARKALAGSRAKTHLVNENFRNLEHELTKRGITKITKALFDLGWSSMQLDSGRGFSFKADEPLLMTYPKIEAQLHFGAGAKDEKGQAILTAAEVVNAWSEKSLADIIYGFGEERYARRIAKAIVERRQKKPFENSLDLAEAISQASPHRYRHGRIHPATRTFQALRIAVNDELGALTEGLAAAWNLLALHGRIAVISFHSVEDRIVKQTFAEWEKRGEGQRINKKPLRSSAEEITENPRSRSAKLRIIEKLEVRD